MAFFDEVKDRINKTTTAVSAKTKVSIEAGKLGSEVRSLEEAIKKLYMEIGKAVCDTNGTVTDEIRSMIGEVSEQVARRDELEKRRLQIRNMHRCPNCGAIMKEDANFCSACGAKMPEIEIVVPEEKQETSVEIEYCPDCGAMRKNMDRYCEICGHDYDGAAMNDAGETADTEQTDAE